MRRAGLTLLEMLIVIAVMAILAMLVVPMLGSGVSTSYLDATYATMQTVRDAIMGSATVPGYRADVKGTSSGRVGVDPLPPVGSGIDYATADAAGLPANRYLTELVVNPIIPGGGFKVFDPQTRRGWRGPYLAQTQGSWGPVFGLPSTQMLVLDSFPFTNSTTQASAPGSPIVIEWPADNSFGPRENFVRLHSFGTDGTASTALATKWVPSSLTPADCGDDVVLYLRRDLPGMDWTNYWDLKKKLQGN